MLILRLFYEFFKIGLFSVGGGLATLPFLAELGESSGWFSASQLADMVAVSESTPGPIGVNMATYVGYTVAGVPGAVVSTLGLIAPSIIIILIIASVLRAFRDNRYVVSVFSCLRPASTGLIAAAGLSVAAITFFPLGITSFSSLGSVSVKALILAAVLIVLTRFIKPTKKLHPIIWILLSAVAGIAFSF